MGSLRDPVLEIQLNQETQQQSRLNTSLGALQQMQTMFSSADSGIGADITNFFRK
jgi:flagellar hook-associated protein FlgK